MRTLLIFAAAMLFASAPAHAEKTGWTPWRGATDADGMATPIEWRARHDGHNPFMEKKAKPAERWDIEFRNTGKLTHWFFFKLTASGLSPKDLGPFGKSKRLDPGETGRATAYTGALKGQLVDLWYEYRKTAKLMREIASDREVTCQGKKRTFTATLITAGLLRIQTANGKDPDTISTLELPRGKAMSSADIRVLGNASLRAKLMPTLEKLACMNTKAPSEGVVLRLKNELLKAIEAHHEQRCRPAAQGNTLPHDCYRRTPTLGIRG